MESLLYNAGLATGFVGGFAFGLLFIVAIAYFYAHLQKADTARYIQRLSPENKDTVITEIKALKEQLLEVAEMTNTKFFNSMYNDLVSLSAWVKRKWVP